MPRSMCQRARIASLGIVFAMVLVSCGKDSPSPSPTGPTSPPASGPPRSTGPLAFTSNRDGFPQIYLANADGSLVTRVTAGSDPSWSPDGRRIAFTGSSAGVYVINADGTGLRRIANGVHPAWSPDGSRIAYMSIQCCPTWTGGIFVVDVDGSGIRKLVDVAHARPEPDYAGEYWVDNPSWSPDGRNITFYAGSYLLFDSHIFIVNDDGADLRKLIYGWNPAWSPTGPLLAFLGFAGGISIVGADGSDRSLIAVPGQVTGRLSWTPNGGLLFNRNGRAFVWEGGAERQLIPDAQAPAVPGYWDSDAVWSR